MGVNKEDIKKLRERTGCGIGDCKKALEEAGGDFEKAIEILRERGLAKAVKKSGREVAEGLLFTKNEDNRVFLVEINCETDFVANTKDFKEFGTKVVEKIWELDLDSIENLPEEIETLRNETVLKLNENIQISRLEKLKGDKKHPLVSYIQMGKNGIIAKFSLENEIDYDSDFLNTLEDIAITILFYNPEYKSFDEIPSDVIEKEKNLILEQLKSDEKFKNKPENVLNNIVNGKLRKSFAENCVYDLPFYKEESKSLKKVLDELSKKVGTRVDIDSYKIIKIGE